MVLGPVALKERTRAITHVALALLRIGHGARAEALANMAFLNPPFVRKDAKDDNATRGGAELETNRGPITLRRPKHADWRPRTP